MKLRNKKTGETIQAIFEMCEGNVKIVNATYPEKYGEYSSIEEVNRDWEDYEEPEEEFWYIDSDCGTYGVSWGFNHNDNSGVLFNKSIGNYFLTKEECKKAVKKLKAWKRLRDNGFRFNGCEDSPVEDGFNIIWFTMKAKVWDEETQEALDLLFGGEE